MYTGDLFKKSLMYARSLEPNEIYILSAQYGLLGLDDIIEPYEKTLNGATKTDQKRWAENVISQMESRRINFNDKAVFLCGKNYRKNIIQKFKNGVAPLSGMGIGKQLQFYNQNRSV